MEEREIFFLSNPPFGFDVGGGLKIERKRERREREREREKEKMSKILLLVSLFLKGRLKYFKLVSKLQSSPKLKFGGLCNFTLLFITENSFERERGK